MDLQRLISEVQARPAIWDQKNTHYHNRDVILKMWREIARACDVSSNVAKSKWKHLRDNFRNELKKTYRSKQQSCDGGSPSNIEHESKWVWFRSLQFLRDQMNSRVIGCGGGTVGGGGGVVQGGHFVASLEETKIEPQIDILEGDEETHFDEFVDGDSCHSMFQSDDVATQQVGMPPPKRNRINRKKVLLDSMECEYQEVERKRYETIDKRLLCRDDNDDDTYHFLMSVRSPLRSLPLERQMYVRLKIQEIILNEITVLQQDSKHHHHRVLNNSVLQNCSPELGNDDNYFS
ncbi:hypothetical protein PV325_000438 [Microctonus aethiopoides]|uniref:Transcription factor Adf-1 n=1 Tax=Microctonus aethiopoides TaxID=144406 RepID=A0AA39C5V5_9HYME|nr:hypothetical protein PV325_000438 [Microctonus aethiopoides]KAK0088053.1 hypothetical protein PV326_004957 [Microctonus aethiopoides]KAK0158469.1 hypothetical protein PV328_009466 [Microctonus aethiopoides]